MSNATIVNSENKRRWRTPQTMPKGSSTAKASNRRESIDVFVGGMDAVALAAIVITTDCELAPVSVVDVGSNEQLICAAPEQDKETESSKPVVEVRVAVSVLLAPWAIVMEVWANDPLKSTTYRGNV